MKGDQTLCGGTIGEPESTQRTLRGADWPPRGPGLGTDGWGDCVDKGKRQRGGGGGEAATHSAGRLRAAARNSSKRWKHLQQPSNSRTHARVCVCLCV